MTVCAVYHYPGILFWIVEIIVTIFLSWILIYKPFKNKQKSRFYFIFLFIGFLFLATILNFAFTSKTSGDCGGIIELPIIETSVQDPLVIVPENIEMGAEEKVELTVGFFNRYEENKTNVTLNISSCMDFNSSEEGNFVSVIALELDLVEANTSVNYRALLNSGDKVGNYICKMNVVSEDEVLESRNFFVNVVE